jgi:hypothetical protein
MDAEIVVVGGIDDGCGHRAAQGKIVVNEQTPPRRHDHADRVAEGHGIGERLIDLRAQPRPQAQMTAIGRGVQLEPEQPKESNVIAIARGSITEPHKLGPFIDDEMRVVRELKDDGVMKALYRRAARPGVVIILEGQSIDAIRERLDTLPFVVEGLMALAYEEVYEI